jgi:hypothetical protein
LKYVLFVIFSKNQCDKLEANHSLGKAKRGCMKREHNDDDGAADDVTADGIIHVPTVYAVGEFTAQATRVCTYVRHHLTTSPFPKDRVPLSLFEKMRLDGSIRITMMCEHCRVTTAVLGANKKENKRRALNAPEPIPIEIDPTAEKTLVCGEHSHDSFGSPHPRKSVPEFLFRTVEDDPTSRLTKTCKPCRLKKCAIEAARKEQRMKAAVSDTQQVCPQCLKIVEKTDMSILLSGEIGRECKSCHGKGIRESANRTAARHAKKLERIIKTECSCERCRIILLKPLVAGSTIVRRMEVVYGFVVYNGERMDVRLFLRDYKDLCDLSTLEWDHIDQATFEDMFPDKIFVPKTKGALHADIAVHDRETEKCQQLCSLCHVIVTIERREKSGKQQQLKNLYAQEKKDFVDLDKIRIGECQLCSCWLPDCLTYYEYDHLDPLTKVACISQMISNSKYSLDDIKTELSGCRLLCRGCHRIHTAMQRADGTSVRVTKFRKQLAATAK